MRILIQIISNGGSNFWSIEFQQFPLDNLLPPLHPEIYRSHRQNMYLLLTYYTNQVPDERFTN